MARADEDKVGKPWRDDELDAIVADYFEMLEAELAGRHYVKAEHSRVLMARIRRTHRSVEFKHQNVSAVLELLGLPWIPGYKPKRNYQKALIPAVDRYLSRHPGILELTPKSVESSAALEDVFVKPPSIIRRDGSSSESDQSEWLVRKYDPLERDHRNRALGKAGEEFVLNLERRRLAEAGAPELAQQVRWVAVEDGDGAGYDVLSFDRSGEERFLEVKTTNGSGRTPFFMTRNELKFAEHHPDRWRLYRVHLFATSPRLFKIAPPLENKLQLSPETWRARFRA